MTPYLEAAQRIQNHCLSHGGICSGPEVLAIIAAEMEKMAVADYRKGFEDLQKHRTESNAQAYAQGEKAGMLKAADEVKRFKEMCSHNTGAYTALIRLEKNIREAAEGMHTSSAEVKNE